MLPLASGPSLEITQRLVFSDTMLEALDSGIPLRLAYHVRWCDGGAEAHVLELRYASLGRRYELRNERDGLTRTFARRGALLAALDRVRLPVSRAAPDCGGAVRMALDLTALPTPLRFPALLESGDWRMVSPEHTWPTPG